MAGEAPPRQFEELKARYMPRWPWRLAVGLFGVFYGWWASRLRYGLPPIPFIVPFSMGASIAVTSWIRQRRLGLWLLTHQRWGRRLTWWLAFGFPEEGEGPRSLSWSAWGVGICGLAIAIIGSVWALLPPA
jgi:lysylphosphatidylglycerol synthetase-like protein (DUF2156 family)